MTIDQRLKRAKRHKKVWPKGSPQRAYWKSVIAHLKRVLALSEQQAETLA
jgi:hypothetical protein